MRHAPSVLILCLPAALGACAPGFGGAGSSSLESLSGSRPVASAGIAADRRLALRLPPEAGAVQSVGNRRYADGVRQEIVLAGDARSPGRNGAEIALRTDNQTSLESRLPMAKPSESGIRAELGERFPGIAMQVVDQPRRNAYGPYGLAVGRGADDVRCLYAWQWIEADTMRTGAAGPTSLRVRLCRAGASLDQLAGQIDRLELARLSDVDLDAAKPAAAPIRTAAARPAPRHRAAAQERTTSQPTVFAAQQSAGAPGVFRHAGRVYLAPVGGQVNSTEAAPPPAGAALARGLDETLPPEAYRGPGGRNGAGTTR